MGDRQLGLTISLSNIGGGQIVKNVPPETLAPPNANGILSPALSPRLSNVRLFEGIARRRNGYTIFTDPITDYVTGIFTASFSPTKQYLVRGTTLADGTGGGTVEWYNEVSGSWETLITSAGNGVLSQPWTFAMVPSGRNSPANLLFFSNAGSDLYYWNGVPREGADDATAVEDDNRPKGVYAIQSYLGRAFTFNILDQGERRVTRVKYSVVGDGLDFTGLGSGSFDLEDDPYPGVALAVIGGRLIMFKGGVDGGAIYVGTPTGLSTAPLRVDAINPSTNVGVVIPRSVTPITSTQAFFLGHDAAYLYDGVRALLPFAENVARDITSRLNPAALWSGHAHYNIDNREVELHVPTGVATTPNETWIFDVRGKRAYGPLEYTKSFLGATQWREQGNETWDTWGQEGATRTWNTITNKAGLEYVQWDLIRNSDVSTPVTIYGTSAGDTLQSTSSTTDDDGEDIACTYYCPPITPKDWLRAKLASGGRGQMMSMRPDDVMVLREVTLRHRSETAWTPIVEVSTDGTTWNVVSDSTQASATNGRLLSKVYHPSNATEPSTWHQVRVRNTDGDAFNVVDIILDFTYAGSERHQ